MTEPKKRPYYDAEAADRKQAARLAELRAGLGAVVVRRPSDTSMQCAAEYVARNRGRALSSAIYSGTELMDKYSRQISTVSNVKRLSDGDEEFSMYLVNGTWLRRAEIDEYYYIVTHR